MKYEWSYSNYFLRYTINWNWIVYCCYRISASDEFYSFDVYLGKSQFQMLWVQWTWFSFGAVAFNNILENEKGFFNQNFVLYYLRDTIYSDIYPRKQSIVHSYDSTLWHKFYFISFDIPNTVFKLMFNVKVVAIIIKCILVWCLWSAFNICRLICKCICIWNDHYYPRPIEKSIII